MISFRRGNVKKGSLFGVLIGAVFGLPACDLSSSPSDDATELERPVITIVESGATENATLSIPRYKIYQQHGAPERIWVGLGMRSGADTFLSDDGGSSWTPVATMGWEFHMSMDGNADGYVHFVNRGQPAATYHRLLGGSFEPEHQAEFNDYGGRTASGILGTNGNEVVVFTRHRDNNLEPIRYHRSNDNGLTWEHGIVDGTGNPAELRHRFGAVVIDGELALAYWKAAGADNGDTVTLFRWDGTAFARLDHVYTTNVRSPWTREFAITQDAAGIIHLVTWDQVDGRRVVRHTRRTLGSDWTEPETVVEWENDNILPQLSAVGERVLLLYMYHPTSSDEPDAQAYYRVWDPSTGWSDALRASEPESAGVRYPIAPQRVAPGSDFVPVVWTEGEAVKYTPLRID